MKFIDEVSVRICGGHGGDGIVAWRREMFVPQGGPNGGNGGNGGAVIFVAESGLNTLIDFALNPVLRAENGGNGGQNNMTGSDGEDLIVPVPVGTQVFYGEQLVADFARVGARWVAARGGIGGKGNYFFRSSTNQAPDIAQKGRPGDALRLHLILKSVADIGFVGLPNVGKSSLISRISRAHPKVADYPFTTLTPHLGVVVLDEKRRFVVADIPGIVEGAHEGKGLGIRFLKHIERTKAILQFVDVSILSAAQDDPINPVALQNQAQQQFEAVENELREFQQDLLDVPRMVVFSKADLPYVAQAWELTVPYFQTRNIPTLLVSSVTGLGITELQEQLFSLMQQGS